MIMMGGGGGGGVFDIGQFITEPDNQFSARLDGLESFEGGGWVHAVADQVGHVVLLAHLGPQEPHPVALSCPETFPCMNDLRLLIDVLASV